MMCSDFFVVIEPEHCRGHCRGRSAAEGDCCWWRAVAAGPAQKDHMMYAPPLPPAAEDLASTSPGPVLPAQGRSCSNASPVLLLPP